ncbi:GNAT family N-acetyltransferase [Cohnella soli]|uniref:GNAT family N-acetyltransferase n=1 Tax=Cohnella soli TaxID=425005 RepID=A0ABW0HMV3_9BACL
MKVMETERLVLRWQSPDDAAFMRELVNDPDWIANIGDRGVKTDDDARNYIAQVAQASYDKYGYGFYIVELKVGGVDDESGTGGKSEEGVVGNGAVSLHGADMESVAINRQVADGRRHVPIGICGLAKRDFMAHSDIGYAFLPAYRGQGYAFEAAKGVLAYARSVLGLSRIAAIVSEGNKASEQLLEKLGLKEEGLIRYGETDEMMRLYGMAL